MAALYFIGLIVAACVVTLLTVAVMAFFSITVYAWLKPVIQPVIDAYKDWYERRTMR